ncbi:DUF7504 family protein [Haloprofundus salilacus]|uniref:DUF7504 family protein n=1 Tax=Haloprofundus salilacus TaxID=2876190 RepID=UPI001CCA05C2|nr:hypothetical protein [Haloprofundus salilacus]
MKTPGQNSFTVALSELKRRGCNILVVGSSEPDARQSLTRRLLGDATTEPRKRLFVFTDGVHTHERLGNGPRDDDSLRVVTQSSVVRGAAATEGLPGSTLGGPVAHEYVEAGDLGSLSWAIGDAITSFQSNGPLETSELRLCLDSLQPLVEDHGVKSVRRFASVVGGRVKSVAGMAHYHLSVPNDDPVVDELADAFDAVIELRMCDGTPEHRWTFPDRALSNDWMPI